MKKISTRLTLIMLLAVLFFSFAPTTALAQKAPSALSETRPQIIVRNYRSNEGPISYGLDFNLIVKLKNETGLSAYNTQVSFSAPELTPRKTGGVIAVGFMPGYGVSDISQPMTVTSIPWGKKLITVEMTLTYTDEAGTAYSEKFSLALDALETSGVYKTPTPQPVTRSQLVITEVKTDVDMLQPGTMFELSLLAQNMGNAPAKSITLIIGGGSTGSGSGTPTAGGVSGSGGELSNFAPLGASNIQAMGDLAAGSSILITQKLIVNVSTDPGAYPFKVTFSYLDAQGNVINDEQVITLLVYRLPITDIGFYQPVGQLFAGQPNLLPIQVVNLGKKTAVLGNLKIETQGGTLEMAQALVGSIEPGGYFTLDATLYPDVPGPLDLIVTIDYTDDFNQPRTITKNMTLDVMEMEELPIDPTIPESNSNEYPFAPEETFWQKTWRFILGIFGLDSAAPTEQPLPLDGEMPMPNDAVIGPKGG
jgi:hypothetical protein